MLSCNERSRHRGDQQPAPAADAGALGPWRGHTGCDRGHGAGQQRPVRPGLQLGGPGAVGGPAAPAAAWDRMWRQLREAGGGIATLAMAAVDIGLWDLQAKAA